MRIITLALGLVVSATSMADWNLQSPSSIHFLTTKNAQVTETNSFTSLTTTTQLKNYPTWPTRSQYLPKTCLLRLNHSQTLVNRYNLAPELCIL